MKRNHRSASPSRRNGPTDHTLAAARASLAAYQAMKARQRIIERTAVVLVLVAAAVAAWLVLV